MRRRWEEGRVQWSVMAEDEEKRKGDGWGEGRWKEKGKTERKKKKCMFRLPDNDDLTVV